MLFLLFAGQGDIASLDQPNEKTIVDGFAQSSNRKIDLKLFHYVIILLIINVISINQKLKLEYFKNKYF